MSQGGRQANRFVDSMSTKHRRSVPSTCLEILAASRLIPASLTPFPYQFEISLFPWMLPKKQTQRLKDEASLLDRADENSSLAF